MPGIPSCSAPCQMVSGMCVCTFSFPLTVLISCAVKWKTLKAAFSENGRGECLKLRQLDLFFDSRRDFHVSSERLLSGPLWESLIHSCEPVHETKSGSFPVAAVKVCETLPHAVCKLLRPHERSCEPGLNRLFLFSSTRGCHGPPRLFPWHVVISELCS